MLDLTSPIIFFFFFNDTATTEIYTLSLHDALPISSLQNSKAAHYPIFVSWRFRFCAFHQGIPIQSLAPADRSEEHTSELQSPCNLVCRLLLEKKKRHLTNCHVFVGRPGAYEVTPSC